MDTTGTVLLLVTAVVSPIVTELLVRYPGLSRLAVPLNAVIAIAVVAAAWWLLSPAEPLREWLNLALMAALGGSSVIAAGKRILKGPKGGDSPRLRPPRRA